MQNVPPDQENYNTPNNTPSAIGELYDEMFEDQENYNTPNNTLSNPAPSIGASSEGMDGKSSMGLKPNIAASLS